MPETQFYTVNELATILNINPATVREHAARGILPARKFGRLWRFPRHKVDAWLEEERPATEPPRERDADPRAERTDSQQRLFRALALAEELDPVVEAGTLGPVDATEDIHALREERMRQIDGE
jgi:excisionase family DNA binding protein